MTNKTDNPFDVLINIDEVVKDIAVHHQILCGCDKINSCVVVYRRCLIKTTVYHSLAYLKRRSTISYFVQYVDSKRNTVFGSIKFFFTYRGQTFALINHHPSRDLFSNQFVSSEYHPLLCKCIDIYFHLLVMNSSSVSCIPIDNVQNMCVVFEKKDYLIVTPLSIGYEHD